MAIVNGYATLAQLKERVSINDSADDATLERVITSASRAIDDHTGRRFWLDAAPTTRHYETDGEGELDVNDVASLSGVIVALDRDDDGVYEETLTLSDYYLSPVDALLDGQPYTRIVLTLFKLPRGARRPALAITATHGWPGATVTGGVAACPTQVNDACLLVAHRLWRRKDTPEGVAGTADTGVVRISKYEDPDAVKLLRSLRYGGEVLVA